MELIFILIVILLGMLWFSDLGDAIIYWLRERTKTNSKDYHRYKRALGDIALTSDIDKARDIAIKALSGRDD